MTSEGSASDAARALLDTLAILWPDADDVVVEHDGVKQRLRRSSRSNGREFVAIPNATSPRLLVPDESRAASGAMRRFSAALDARDTLGRLAVSAALRVGGTRLFGDRFRVTLDGPDRLSDELAGIIGGPVHLSLGVGTARANRKPILEVFDEEGRSRAFVKVGTTDDTRDAVRHEARSLTRLAEVRWKNLELPHVLHAGDWGGHFLLVMSPLATTVRQPRRHELPRTAMEEFGTAFGSAPQRLGDSTWMDRCRHQATSVGDDELRSRFRASIDRFEDRAGDDEWPIGAWHGDWTPWNMARRDGRVQLWDLERFDADVPLGLDRFHFEVNRLLRRDGVTVETIDAGLRTASAEDDAHASTVGAGAYLIAILGRYLPSVEREGGHLIEDQATTTLDALERVLA